MENTREHIYLAALLHDIGKFYQRADTGAVGTSKYLKDYCRQENTFCPNYNGTYSHKHVLWTAQFIDDYSSVFKSLIGADSSDLKDKNNLMDLAACHHLSKEQLSDYGRIIKLADSLSSGMDRDSQQAFRDSQGESSWDSFKKKRMVSILETIANENDKECKYHLPVRSLCLNESYFPQQNIDNDPDYKSLWEGFIGEFKFIQANTYRAFSETLLSLLYKYTSTIPASTINFPDVSLYDHLKTTAALAVCLYDVEYSEENPKNPFLLIGGDLSGIQSYIYQIVSKYAGKNLKGRSYYLRILLDAVVRYILKTLNLFLANVVYNSGGSFYILAPNTEFVRNKIDESITAIEHKFFDSFGTLLYLAMDYVELSKNALLHQNGENLGKVWGELFEKRDQKKSRKFVSEIKANYDSFFEPSKIGADTPRDSITGEEFRDNEKVIEKESLTLRPITYEQIRLGELLRDTDIMVISEQELTYWCDPGCDPVCPAELGFYYYFLNNAELNEKSEQLKASADKVTVMTFNGKDGNCDFMGMVNGLNNIYSLEFYGGNEFNYNTYEELCDPNGDKNFSRLGVLRMDVDNLGKIFQSGIAQERATLSRYAALSRSFDYFFSGYLNTIWKEQAEKESLIIYSGGDDVFIVGSWDATIRLAKGIKEDFKLFTCNNTALSISAGIAIIEPKYPIMKGADESAEEESNAKEHHCGEQQKNSISFMNFALNWEYEFEAVERLKSKIVDLSSKNLPKSFISKVLAHYMNANIQDHKITNLKTYWMMTYDLSRMEDRIKDNECTELIENCKKEIYSSCKLDGNDIHTAYHPLELWAFACRWADLEIRNLNKK